MYNDKICWQTQTIASYKKLPYSKLYIYALNNVKNIQIKTKIFICSTTVSKINEVKKLRRE